MKAAVNNTGIKKTRDAHEVKMHGLTVAPAVDTEISNGTEEDSVFNYCSSVLKLGLLYQDFCDSIKEGDGDRKAMLWKYLTLLFFETGRKKYALESLIFTARTNATLSARKAEQLKWNRFANERGGSRNNMPLDLRMEHLNKSVKQGLKRLGPNLTESAAIKMSRSADGVQEVVTSYDKMTRVKQSSGYHASSKSERDFSEVLKELQKGKVAEFHKGRQFYCSSLKNYSHDVLKDLDVFSTKDS